MGDMNFVVVCIFLFALASWMLRVKFIAQFSTALNCLIIFFNLSSLANICSLALIFFYYALILYCFKTI